MFIHESADQPIAAGKIVKIAQKRPGGTLGTYARRGIVEAASGAYSGWVIIHNAPALGTAFCWQSPMQRE
jgi:hypothetical protein